MRHRVYMRDWFFNAGIVGFLRIVSDNAMPDDLKNISGLEIGDNYIEFDSEILNGFEDRFRLYAFDMLMDLNLYRNKLNALKKEIPAVSEKDDPEKSVKKLCKIFSGSYLKFNETVLNKNFENCSSLEDLSKEVNESLDFLSRTDAGQIYEKLIKTEAGTAYLSWFLDGWQLKGITSGTNISQYAVSAGQEQKIKNSNDYCLSCQERKAEFEFNNSISNIIGFNKDNTNWIWGYKPSKLRLCSVCSIIYTCAFLGMIKLHRFIRENSVDCFYFINDNTDIKSLYKEALSLQSFVSMDTDVVKKPFVLIVKDIVLKLLEAQSKDASENINFIEVAENPLMGGQTTKGYNIYNYSLTSGLASFLKKRLSDNNIPEGYYKLKEGSYSMDDELLKKTIDYSLGYNDIYFYTSLYMRKRTDAHYSPVRVNNFIFDYINSIQNLEGGIMTDRQKVTKKAYANGRSLADLLRNEKRENQIDGIVYGLLGDLKISDREKFLDKYIRLMMSHNMSLAFGSNNEMDDTDSFLQFGYSFINGLLSNYGNNNQEKSNE